MKRNGTTYSSVGRMSLTVLALAALSVPVLLSAAQAQGTVQQRVANIRGTIIDATELEFDFGKQQYILTGDVKLRTKDSRLDADKMTVQINKARELEWAKCEGKVFLERTSPQDGTLMTGRGRSLEYFEQKQLANLKGGVVVTQSSPRLLKPAEITGDHVDMNLQTKVNVVHGGGGKQAKVHVEPKGNGAPAGGKAPANPEPVDLVGDQIQMNSETQEYVASGSPRMQRPSTDLRAKTIRFQVDPGTNEVKTAYAEENVIFDGRGDQGSVIHATGDKGTYTQATNEVALEGNVHATVKDPDETDPSVYQGARFLYNTATGNRKLVAAPGGKASVVLPERAQPGGKPGDKPAEKPAAPVTPASDTKKTGR